MSRGRKLLNLLGLAQEESLDNVDCNNLSPHGLNEEMFVPCDDIMNNVQLQQFISNDVHIENYDCDLVYEDISKNVVVGKMYEENQEIVPNETVEEGGEDQSGEGGHKEQTIIEETEEKENDSKNEEKNLRRR